MQTRLSLATKHVRMRFILMLPVASTVRLYPVMYQCHPYIIILFLKVFCLVSQRFVLASKIMFAS